MTVQSLTQSRVIEVATILGITLGIGLLVVSYFAPSLRILALPGLAMLLPALVYGMR